MTQSLEAFGPVSVPVSGSDQPFPVRNIYCVGRNYWAHRAEMGVTDRDPPFFFQKRLDGLLFCPEGEVTELAYPPMTTELHHEVELVVALGKGGSNIDVSAAPAHIFGYAIGLDMTRRDLQAEAKKKGRPWDTAKNFEGAAPIGTIHPISQTGEILNGRIQLSVNDEIRQDAQMDEMITNVAETIEDLSRFHTLYAGDLIFTGTPAGVAAVGPGDILEAEAERVGRIEVKIT